ncbi:MAG: hypothetical protein QF681_14970 [Vicinamibacterales bacterium]|jgi:hypothetical protein|nr:hypothetical protein [Vicinamibacterales bacterium]
MLLDSGGTTRRERGVVLALVSEVFRSDGERFVSRSPSYVVRQLYDLQIGVRNGAWSEMRLW